VTTIYFVAGEVSADNHGAALMHGLRKVDSIVRFAGRGGPQMKAIAGDLFKNWIDRSAVVGLWEVITHYRFFRQQFGDTLDEIAATKPDVVLLIDYPGFNLRLARAVRQRSLARKIIYYISPQVWAWNRGRIKQMARSIDLVLCIFPFEAELYNRSGLRTIFVGHPMIDRLQDARIRGDRDPNLIGLFPGSRSREVKKILPIMIDAARHLVRQKPNLRFEIAAASPEIARQVEQIAHKRRDSRDLFTINVGEANALMQRAFAGIVASGSATLEAAYFRLPFVLVYKVSWLTYLVGRAVVKVNYLGMPNLLANGEVVPEFIQHRAEPKQIAAAVLRLLDDRAARERMIASFDQVIASLGGGGASARAASAILAEL
jgi:lipid-A-disaccharide synthase